MALAACFAMSGPARAADTCAETLRLSDQDVRAKLDLIGGAARPDGRASDDWDRLTALNDLVCAERPAVRDVGIRAGLLSESALVQTEATFLALANRSSIVMRFVRPEGVTLTREQVDFIAKQNEIVLHPVFADARARCISTTWPDRCGQNSAFFLGPDGVLVKVSHSRALLKLDERSHLAGEYEERGVRVPVEIRMF